jgi:hypothetical protein
MKKQNSAKFFSVVVLSLARLIFRLKDQHAIDKNLGSFPAIDLSPSFIDECFMRFL